MQVRRASGFEVAAREAAELPRIIRLSDDPRRPAALRKSEGFISRNGDMPEGFAWYLVIGKKRDNTELPERSAAVFLPTSFDHLHAGDVVRITAAPRTSVAVLYQRAARHNSFLLTERCNNYCLMCSQPPRDADDDWIVGDLMAAIPLVDPETHEIGFTGGEPGLLGEKLVTLIRQCRSYLPHTGLHVLSNGRAFIDEDYCRSIAEVNHHDLMFGIPVYSDLSEIHDYVVQADGAFDETIRGILNLKKYRVMVEIRVVVHKQTYERLPALARFIARNLTFIDQVVFMGLEMTGFTKANLNDLWIDPVDYQVQLVEAVQYLTACRIRTSVYNHQLCITDRALWAYTKRSISDWKNEYMAECDGCTMRSECAGFFSSAKLRYSAHIKAIVN